jgi:dTDP-4-amino-4,6-dideoxygalactose transaminase
LDAIQAGILHAKLGHLAEWNTQRRERAALYTSLLEVDQALSVPFEPSWSRAVYHLYVIRTDDREGLMSHLKDAGIGVGIHYPVPLHLQKAYLPLNYSLGDFPIAERVSTEVLSIPMFPHLAEAMQRRVANEILGFLRDAGQKADVSEEAMLAPEEWAS